MDGSDITKREEQILTGVAEKVGATLGSVAASAETMSKRLATAATEAGKAYRASMRGTATRKRSAAKTRVKRSVRRASASVKRVALKTRARKAGKRATRKPVRRPRTRD